MKTLSIIAINLLTVSVIRAVSLYGNLAFYGRGHRRLPRYWSELSNIKTEGGTVAYFPYTEAGEEEDPPAEAREEGEEEQISVDKAINYPLNIYFPGINATQEYTEIRFEVERGGIDINFREYATLKSEMKFRPPPVEKLIAEGYTCESIGLTCTDLESYDFEANADEWLSKVDYRIFFEDPEKMNSDDYSAVEKEDFQYYLDTFPSPTNKWEELISSLGNSMDVNSIFTSFIMRNYGTMPVYLSIGNTVFLKKKDTTMFKSGKFQIGFADWSWGNRTVEVYEKDSKKEESLYFIADTDGNSACYISVTTFDVGFSAPSEAISFRIRPMQDNNFHFRVSHSDNSNWLVNLTDILVERNCDIPIGEESTVLVDIRSHIYLDAKRMLKNEVSGFWVQSISEIDKIKAELKETKGEQASLDYLDTFYFYEYTLHHTYPTDLSKFNTKKRDKSGPDCDITMHNHQNWNATIRWPDDVTFDEIYSSKNIANGVIGDTNLENNTSTAAPSPSATVPVSESATSKPTTTPQDDKDGAMSNKAFSMSLLFVILSFFTLFF